LFKCV